MNSTCMDAGCSDRPEEVRLDQKSISGVCCYLQILCRWVLSVKKNYRPVSYHNWRHALNVCQTMFTVLKTGKMDRFMDDLEVCKDS